MFIGLLLFLLTAINADTNEKSDRQHYIHLAVSPPNYKVRNFPKHDIIVDGNVNERSWQRCQVINNLHCPWETSSPGTADFRACYDQRFFYFSFVVRDSVGLYKDEKTEMAVAQGDRVELFFSADSSMANYYCLEIAPNGNVLDYQASYHRNFNNNWDIQGAKIVAKPSANGYTVEGKMPVAFLKKLSYSASLKGTVIPAGVFRARKKPGADPEAFLWYSWVDPHVAIPDFHVPAALGRFEF